MVSVKDRLFIAIFSFGIVFTFAAGIFSLILELQAPSDYSLAMEEYHDLQILGDFTEKLLDLRREGINYLIMLKDEDLADFHRSKQSVDEIMKLLENEKAGLGDPKTVNIVLANTREYIRDFDEIISDAAGLQSKEALSQIRELVGSGRLDYILKEVVELDKKNYLDYTRVNHEILAAASRTRLILILFETAALSLIALSGIILWLSYRRSRILLRQTEELKNRLEEKNKELESFIRIVSHDLRAPLININGFSNEIAKYRKELAEIIDSVSIPSHRAKKADTILQSHLPEAIHFITASADSLNRLIESMVKAARAGQLPVHAVEIDAAKLICEILKDFDFRIKQTGAEVKIEKLPDCIADADQVRQIFSNIIDNALKYRDPTRQLKLHIWGTVEDHQSGYCFEDNGIGIAEKDIESIFNLYHQLQRKEMTGEGIGLHTVKKMVEHNGGRIEVHSQLGKGSRFWIWLPAAG